MLGRDDRSSFFTNNVTVSHALTDIVRVVSTCFDRTHSQPALSVKLSTSTPFTCIFQSPLAETWDVHHQRVAT